MSNEVDYGAEFDELVRQLNQELSSSEGLRSAKKKGHNAFLRGMASIFGLRLPRNPDRRPYLMDYIYREDLTGEQKDAVGLASDYLRVCGTLDSVISSEAKGMDIAVEQAQSGRRFFDSMYQHLRKAYVSQAKRKSLLQK